MCVQRQRFEDDDIPQMKGLGLKSRQLAAAASSGVAEIGRRAGQSERGGPTERRGGIVAKEGKQGVVTRQRREGVARAGAVVGDAVESVGIGHDGRLGGILHWCGSANSVQVQVLWGSVSIAVRATQRQGNHTGQLPVQQAATVSTGLSRGAEDVCELGGAGAGGPGVCARCSVRADRFLTARGRCVGAHAARRARDERRELRLVLCSTVAAPMRALLGAADPSSSSTMGCHRDPPWFLPPQNNLPSSDLLVRLVTADRRQRRSRRIHAVLRPLCLSFASSLAGEGRPHTSTNPRAARQISRLPAPRLEASERRASPAASCQNAVVHIHRQPRRRGSSTRFLSVQRQPSVSPPPLAGRVAADAILSCFAVLGGRASHLPGQAPGEWYVPWIPSTADGHEAESTITLVCRHPPTGGWGSNSRLPINIELPPCSLVCASPFRGKLFKPPAR
ncbi:hypothetical protein FH972_026573 [Carpinus fangiana]|uniref:Uncharacterized protein n=1 Tax=Carpinus fangiana TaxID=176857 RepID=A0A5N6L5C4_9ROSI|nr:hypothetical protein FH972_026573 [Carpinus fangiana]